MLKNILNRDGEVRACGLGENIRKNRNFLIQRRKSLCQRETELVRQDKAREQAEEPAWEEEGVGEAEWGVINLVQAPVEIASALTAGRRHPINRAYHVIMSSVPSVDHK